MEFLYNPTSTKELVVYYFVWTISLFILHSIWDKYSSRTCGDNWKNFESKMSELYSAGTVASSMLIGLIMIQGFEKHALFDEGTIAFPLMMAVGTGVLVGLSGLKPKQKHSQETAPALNVGK